jgi:hypothetical protein
VLETRRATLASLLRKVTDGIRLSEHIDAAAHELLASERGAAIRAAAADMVHPNIAIGRAAKFLRPFAFSTSQLRRRLLLALSRWLGRRRLGRLRRDDGLLLLGRDLDGRAGRRLRGWLRARGGLIGFVWYHGHLPPQ